MKGLRFTKIFKEIKFEGVCCKLKSKEVIQRQSVQKYIRRSVIFTWNSAVREKFHFYILEVFWLVLSKFSFLQEDVALGYYSMKFRHLPNISWHPKILSLNSFGNSWGKIVYNVFVSNNFSSFHFWRDENLEKRLSGKFPFALYIFVECWKKIHIG